MSSGSSNFDKRRLGHRYLDIYATYKVEIVEPSCSSKYDPCISIDKDIQELEYSIDFAQSRGCKKRFSLMGHSTGCASILHYLRSHRAKKSHRIRAVILHASISLRDYLFHRHSDTAERLKWAEEQCAAGNDRVYHRKKINKLQLLKYCLF